MLKIAIIGSRKYKPLEDVHTFLDRLRECVPNFMVITGGAKGVDKAAEQWCLERVAVECEVIRPRDPSMKIDYLFRNVEILTKADMIVAFWDGESRGTKFVIDYCNARGKFLRIMRSDGK